MTKNSDTIVSSNNTIQKPDPQKLKEGRAERQALRASRLTSAIDSGVPTTTITSPLSLAEQETIIVIPRSGPCSIDTTIPADMNKCLDREYPITSITLFNSKPVGASFQVPRNRISFRSCTKKEENS